MSKPSHVAREWAVSRPHLQRVYRSFLFSACRIKTYAVACMSSSESDQVIILYGRACSPKCVANIKQATQLSTTARA